MLDALKEKGKTLGHDLGHAWDVMSDGWRELAQRSSNALTRFVHAKDSKPSPVGALLGSYPRWSLLAGEVEETEREIIVRLEIPGMEKEDCQVKIDGNRLFLNGEKHFERTSDKSSYHVMERAYGSFQRVIPLPQSVVGDAAAATYRNGVLTVHLPKQASVHSRSIPVSG
jgi:HSP20 family protein